MALHSPIKLAGEAKSFWSDHAPTLRKRRILTENSVYSFVLLCQTWAQLQELSGTKAGAANYREMVQLHALRKDYFQLARQFGLLPGVVRKKVEGDDADPDETDEFGL